MKDLKKIGLFLIAVCMVCGLAVLTPKACYAATKYYETNEATDIKKGPGSDYKRVISLPKDAVMKVTSKKNSKWYKVEYQNSKQKKYKGYVKASKLDKAVTYKVTKKAAIREDSKGSSDEVKSVSKGKKLFVVNTSNKKWYKVVYYTGSKVYRGYVKSSKLKKTGSSSSSSGKSSSKKSSSSKSSSSDSSTAGKGTGDYKDTMNEKYTATCSVNMRARTSSSSKVVTVVGKGDTVHVTSTADGYWYKCTYVNSSAKRCTGFIAKKFLKKK